MSRRMNRGPAVLALAAALATWVGSARAQDLDVGSETARHRRGRRRRHGWRGGRSKSPAYPSLAGQPAAYTARQLMDFRAQQRAEADSKAYMWGVSALLDDGTIQALAAYYEKQTPPAGRSKAPAALLRTGQKLFQEGSASQGIRACAACHGDHAEGAAGFPRLAGQHADYLVSQLKIFSTRLRPHGVLMKAETASMTPAQMKAVAAYLQSL